MANHLEQVELDKVQSLVNEVRKIEGEFFRASVQKQEMEQVCNELLQEMRTANASLQSAMNDLKDKYGDIVVNLQDGTYEDAPAKEEQAEQPELTVIRPE
jgi:DNA-binding FrmR family transcriptional regulator